MTFNPAQEKFPLRQKSWLQKSNLLAQNVQKAVTGEHDTPRLGCPLFPRKRRFDGAGRMSALGQKADVATANPRERTWISGRWMSANCQ